MVRHRSSHAQSVVGWTSASAGGASTAVVGVAKSASPVVVTPSATGMAIALLGLAVTLYYRGMFEEKQSDLVILARLNAELAEHPAPVAYERTAAAFPELRLTPADVYTMYTHYVSRSTAADLE